MDNDDIKKPNEEILIDKQQVINLSAITPSKPKIIIRKAFIKDFIAIIIAFYLSAATYSHISIIFFIVFLIYMAFRNKFNFNYDRPLLGLILIISGISSFIGFNERFNSFGYTTASGTGFGFIGGFIFIVFGLYFLLFSTSEQDNRAETQKIGNNSVIVQLIWRAIKLLVIIVALTYIGGALQGLFYPKI